MFHTKLNDTAIRVDFNRAVYHLPNNKPEAVVESVSVHEIDNVFTFDITVRRGNELILLEPCRVLKQESYVMFYTKLRPRFNAFEPVDLIDVVITLNNNPVSNL
jgi:hypothetical protein